MYPLSSRWPGGDPGGSELCAEESGVGQGQGSAPCQGELQLPRPTALLLPLVTLCGLQAAASASGLPALSTVTSSQIEKTLPDASL